MQNVTQIGNVLITTMRVKVIAVYLQDVATAVEMKFVGIINASSKTVTLTKIVLQENNVLMAIVKSPVITTVNVIYQEWFVIWRTTSVFLLIVKGILIAHKNLHAGKELARLIIDFHAIH